MLAWIILSDSTNSCVFKITDFGSRQIISARMKNKKYIFNIEANIITASQFPPTLLRGLSVRVHADWLKGGGGVVRFAGQWACRQGCTGALWDFGAR